MLFYYLQGVSVMRKNSESIQRTGPKALDIEFDLLDDCEGAVVLQVRMPDTLRHLKLQKVINILDIAKLALNLVDGFVVENGAHFASENAIHCNLRCNLHFTLHENTKRPPWLTQNPLLYSLGRLHL